jgi:hypothetical protein
MKSVHVFILTTAFMLTALSLIITKTVGVSDFEKGSVSFSISSKSYPPGTDDFIHKGYPVSYYTAYNVLPDPEMNRQNIEVLKFIIDYILIVAVLYGLYIVSSKFVH